MKLFLKILRWILLVVYIYFILTKTIIGRYPRPESIFRGLGWEIEQGYWGDILLNILLFVPVGLLIGGWKGILFGSLLSVGIEIAQYYFRIGFCELDDILNNTVGSAVGALIQRVLINLVKEKRHVP